MKTSSAIALVLLLGTAIAPVKASPITWYLSTLNFTFGAGPELTAGGVGTGSFTYDAVTNTYSAWNINVSGFGYPPANGLFTPATSYVSFASAEYFDLTSLSGQGTLEIGFFSTFNPPNQEPLPNSGSVDVLANLAPAPPFSIYSWQTEGTASTVPEPASVNLILLGGVVLCMSSIFLHRRLSRRP